MAKVLGLPSPKARDWITDRRVQDSVEGVVIRRSLDRATPGMSEAEMWKFTEPPDDALASRGLTPDACRAYGVRWDAAREMWITTVRDPETGQLWGWQEKNARHFNNYPRDIQKSRALFGYGLLPQGCTAFLVESPLDVPYVWPGCPDDVYPVSSYGAHVSAEQVSLLQQRCDVIILGFDNDEAGLKSLDRLAWQVDDGTPCLAFRYRGYERAGADWHADLDGRDPGNLSMDDIRWGLEHPVGARRVR